MMKVIYESTSPDRYADERSKGSLVLEGVVLFNVWKDQYRGRFVLTAEGNMIPWEQNRRFFPQDIKRAVGVGTLGRHDDEFVLVSWEPKAKKFIVYRL